ncbi:MAG: hypothetical protein LBK57_01465 [Clostridiales Family XIII bacterium]|jgi:hypothetical protein|nr:hypothetical protein [Clostridiales Family XIII bacterium]
MARYYERKELESLTEYKLREISREEMLVKSAVFELDRYELIDLILSYRGAGEPVPVPETDEEGMERLSEILGVSVRLSENERLEAPSKIVVFVGTDITETDGLMIKGSPLPEAGVAFLMSGGKKLCAVFGLKKGRSGEMILMRNGKLPARESDERSYSLWCADRESAEHIFALWRGEDSARRAEFRAVNLPILDFSVCEPITAETPLAIDFGTTNTTMGIYLDFDLAEKMRKQGGLRDSFAQDAVNPVYIIRDGARSPLIPTVVAALDVSGSDVEYVFGEEALALSTSAYAQEGLSVFLDIKRWISAPYADEEVIDKTGRRRTVSRKDIIRAYLLHLIGLAEQYCKCKFKNIHISAPVKQRHRFRGLFEELLPEYTLLDVLDEGAAVLYNSVAEQIKNGNFENGRDYRALIVDCGGGTTDLSSCLYHIETGKAGYHVSMETVHENGDVNFGGNSLTYRLLKLLKIMAAEKLGSGVINTDAIWASFPNDAYRFTDEHGRDAFYAELDRQYEAAEALIPTKFKEWEKHGRSDYLQVKSNFYDLFRLAEQVKETFFGARDVLAMSILSREDYESGKRRGAAYDALTVPFAVPRWTFSVATANGLRKKKDWPALTLSVRQIETLFAADIYAVMKKFLDKPFWNNELQLLNSIKLTGQSCKITLFRDVLKEFVPGMLLSFGKAGEDDDPYSLKLTCLFGALQCLSASRSGFVKLDMPRRQPFLPYLLAADTHTGGEKILIDSLDAGKLTGHVSRHFLDLSLKLKLRDSDGAPKYDFAYHSDPAAFKPVVYEEIAKRHDFVPQDETDDIVENEVKFFVAAKPDEWGFVVVPVARKAEGLLLGQEQFFAVEDSAWETDYFDGLK